jgi:hypothetical protein
MGNHFHLVLENTSGKMSDFMRQLNGHYAMNYRKIMGGQRYVFQNRFKSTLIENDSYLLTSIAYTLLNPVRARLVDRYDGYVWSSANDYFKADSPASDMRFGVRRGIIKILAVLGGSQSAFENGKVPIFVDKIFHWCYIIHGGSKMKNKIFHGKKLTLNKRTITRLNNNEFKAIQGQRKETTNGCPYISQCISNCWEATCGTLCAASCLAC